MALSKKTVTVDGQAQDHIVDEVTTSTTLGEKAEVLARFQAENDALQARIDINTAKIVEIRAL